MNADYSETRVLLLRHAETSAPDRFHGAESDIGLGEVGERQARATAEALQAVKPSIVYSSGMRRAIATATPIAQIATQSHSPSIIPELHERRMGTFSNVSIETARSVVLPHIEKWAEGDLNASHEGAESYAEIRERVVGPFVEAAQRHRGETIVMILHGVVIRVLITSLITDYGPDRYSEIAIRNVAVNDLRFDGVHWRIAQLDCDADDPILIV